jgi:hypothetical protein
MISRMFPPQGKDVPYGEYSYLVYSEGGVFKVMNRNGVIEMSSPSPVQALQYAVDNCPIRGTVILASDATLTSTLVIWKQIRFIFPRLSCVADPGIQIGTETNRVDGAVIEGLDLLGPANNTNDCILLKNCNFLYIHINRLGGFRRGIYINPPSNCAVGENFLKVRVIWNCNTAIEFAQTTNFMEGNVFYSAIFSCNIGFRTYANSDAVWNTYFGVIDNSDVSNSYDIYDERGNNLFLMYFVRLGNSIIGSNSLVFALNYKGWNYLRVLGAVRTFVKAGAPTDSDIPSPEDGAIVVDSANNRLWVRVGGVWKYVSLT